MLFIANYLFLSSLTGHLLGDSSNCRRRWNCNTSVQEQCCKGEKFQTIILLMFCNLFCSVEVLITLMKSFKLLFLKWYCGFAFGSGWLMLVLLMIEKIFYAVLWWWFFDGLEDCVLEQCGKGEDRIKPSHWKCCFFCLPDGIAAIHQDLMLLLKFSSHFIKYHVQIAGPRFAWKHLVHFLPTHVNLVLIWGI